MRSSARRHRAVTVGGYRGPSLRSKGVSSMPTRRFTNEAWLFLAPLVVASTLVALLYRSVIVELVTSLFAR